MQLDGRELGFQKRPFGFRFLHAVLTVDAMSCGEDREDVGLAEGLGDGNDMNGGGITAGLTRGGSDAVLHFSQSASDGIGRSILDHAVYPSGARGRKT
jgi:hypothetical protein